MNYNDVTFVIVYIQYLEHPGTCFATSRFENLIWAHHSLLQPRCQAPLKSSFTKIGRRHPVDGLHLNTRMGAFRTSEELAVDYRRLLECLKIVQ